MVKYATAAAGISSAINVGLSYKKRSKAIEDAVAQEIENKRLLDEQGVAHHSALYRSRVNLDKTRLTNSVSDRRWFTGGAVGLGVAATMLVSAGLRTCLPLARRAEAEILMNKCPLVRHANLRSFFRYTETYSLPDASSTTAFDNLREKNCDLFRAVQMLERAEKDFARDGNQDEVKKCKDLRSKIATVERHVNLLLAIIRHRSHAAEKKNKVLRKEITQQGSRNNSRLDLLD